MAKVIDSKVCNINDRIRDAIMLANEYISSNENWMFYFMSPFLAKRGNPFGALFDVMEDYPEDWKDRISFEVRNVASRCVGVNIYIDNGTETPTTLRGNILLTNFEKDVKNNFEAKKIDIRERRKKDLLETKENLEYKLKEIEKELEDITKEEEKESKHDSWFDDAHEAYKLHIKNGGFGSKIDFINGYMACANRHLMMDQSK